MNFIYRKRVMVSFVILILLACGFFLREPLQTYSYNLISFVKDYSQAKMNVVDELGREIFSAPLIVNGPWSSHSTPLSAAEVIRLTNIERAALGAATLQENLLLDQAAMNKIKDMFAKQYFEHVSPEGKGPAALATDVGYSYVVVGENLALGSFKDEQDLIKAWMNSPGHRANIVNTRYQEMGAAVLSGMYKGQKVWLAVQEFGKPSSACPELSNSLRLQVEADKNRVTNMSSDLAARKKELESMPHETASDNDAYNARVAEYNRAVAAYNKAIEDLRTEVDTYNQQVRAFNACTQQ